MLKKLFIILVTLAVVGCSSGTKTSEKETNSTPTAPISQGENSASVDSGGEVVDYYELNLSLPSTSLLPNAVPSKVEDAPDLLISGMVLDTFQYFKAETMSAYEYVKVFNNTEEPYNLKNHRLVLGVTTQGQNIENADAKAGNKALATGYLFTSFFQDDLFIEPLSYALLWVKPYYWTAACGSNTYSGIYNTGSLTYRDVMNQTMEEFRGFWGIDETVQVIEATNMAVQGKRPDLSGGNPAEAPFAPILSPAAGSCFTHLNSTLLRSFEIQKFTGYNNTTVGLENDYSKMSDSERADPPYVAGRNVFNVITIKDQEGNVQDGYYYEDLWNYWEPIVRATFCGRINAANIKPTTDRVSFIVTSAESDPDGIRRGWDNTVELQFRPPKVGEKIMQLQLAINEYTIMSQYMVLDQFELLRVTTKNLATYRYVDTTIRLIVDPNDPEVVINWRADEIASPGRMSLATPGSMKEINFTREV